MKQPVQPDEGELQHDKTMEKVSYEQFKESWLAEIKAEAGSTLELSRRFAHKLVCDWLDIEPSSGDVSVSDGASDGGIDVAVLQQNSEIGEDDGQDIWYLVQSKYGSAFSGAGTVYEDGMKLIETIVNPNAKLNADSARIVERVRRFIENHGDKDKLHFVLATVDDVSEEAKKALENLKIIGNAKIGPFFEVDSISINTIYNRILDSEAAATKKKSFVLKLNAYGEKELLFGAVGLSELYEFLKNYKSVTNDLDLLYEKNVRRYLGMKKVAKGIKETLIKEPERFGLYNNGITFVVEDCEKVENGWRLVEPYIVNGCQTTRTIYDVLSTLLDSGGKNQKDDPVFAEWYERFRKGFVVTKIVKVGADGDELLEKTTRYTNSQNAVSEKDFISLNKDFRGFKDEMQSKYGIFLEIQRGEKDAERARQKNNPNVKPYFREFANAFDLIKVYGAGWLSMPGPAFGKLPAFAPGGSVFKMLTEDPNFGVDDLYAAYQINKFAVENHFGKQGAETRGSTRLLFIFVVVELFRKVMGRAGLNPEEKSQITRAMLKLMENKDLTEKFFRFCVELIEEYMSKVGSEYCVYNEPRYKLNGDLNSFLKSEQLGRDRECTPELLNLLDAYKRQLSFSGLLDEISAHLRPDD
ncbi:MAG: AIPR family protein, partial [Bacteroidia bacterium]|nr:AIPR family protein [Bacteroidia bacterium]MDW8334452.1 AIPR family protein [Bacteroidia bacterium]